MLERIVSRQFLSLKTLLASGGLLSRRCVQPTDRKSCAYARQCFNLVCSGNGLNSSNPTPENAQPGGSLRQAKSIGQTSEPKLDRKQLAAVIKGMVSQALDKIDESLTCAIAIKHYSPLLGQVQRDGLRYGLNKNKEAL